MLKKEVYQIERFTAEDFDLSKRTFYNVYKRGVEIQQLHYCSFERLVEYFTAIEEDIKKNK